MHIIESQDSVSQASFEMFNTALTHEGKKETREAVEDMLIQNPLLIYGCILARLLDIGREQL